MHWYDLFYDPKSYSKVAAKKCHQRQVTRKRRAFCIPSLSRAVAGGGDPEDCDAHPHCYYCSADGEFVLLTPPHALLLITCWSFFFRGSKHREMDMVLVMLRSTTAQFSDAISTKCKCHSISSTRLRRADASVGIVLRCATQSPTDITPNCSTRGLADNYGWTWLPL